jgi:hypothetical protein
MKTKDISQALSMSLTTVYAAIKAAGEGAGHNPAWKITETAGSG